MKSLCAFLSLMPVLLVAEPKVDPNAVMLPTFVFDQRHSITAGVAFPIEEAGQKFLATAYHILGPAGGLPRPISASEVPSEVKAIAGFCLGDQQTVIIAQPALFVKEARMFDADGAPGDVAFARVADARPVPALRFSAVSPKKGDRVWLFARLVDRDRPTLYPALVIDASESLIQYAFENSRLNLRAMSGAPVLTEEGTVGAMHLSFALNDDRLVGIAMPAAAMRERLKEALAGPKPK